GADHLRRLGPPLEAGPRVVPEGGRRPRLRRLRLRAHPRRAGDTRVRRAAGLPRSTHRHGHVEDLPDRRPSARGSDRALRDRPRAGVRSGGRRSRPPARRRASKRMRSASPVAGGRLPALALAAVTALVFAPGVFGEFVWDDKALIVRGTTDLVDAVTSSFWEADADGHAQ